MSEWLPCEFECRVEFPPATDFVDFAACAMPCEEERLACMMASPEPACNNNTLNNIAHLPFQINVNPTTPAPTTTTTTAAPTTTTTAPKTTTTTAPPPTTQAKPVIPSQPRVQAPRVQAPRAPAPRVQAPARPVVSRNPTPQTQPNHVRSSRPRVQAPVGPVVSASAGMPNPQQRVQSPYNTVISRGPRPVIAAAPAAPQQNVAPSPPVSAPQPQQIQKHIVPPRNIFSGSPKQLSYPKPSPPNRQQRPQNPAQQNFQGPMPASNKLSAIGSQPTNVAPAPTVQKAPSNNIYNRLKSKHVKVHKLSYSFKTQG